MGAIFRHALALCTEAAWGFSAGLATFAVVMVLAGRLQAKLGPRPIAIAGGLVLGIGYMLGGWLGSTFIAQKTILRRCSA